MIKYILSLLAAATFLVGCGGCIFSRSVRDLLAKSSPAVVLIDTRTGHCTGFHIGNGIIVTAGHCVEPEASLTIIDSHGHRFKPEVIKDNNSVDIAILSVRDPLLDIDHLVIGDEPEYGERLMTIGFPWYAKGIKVFEVGYLKWILQTSKQRLLVSDSISFRGESGGPCLDERGFVVGIVVAISVLQDDFDRKNLRHQHKDLSLIASVVDLKKQLKSLE